MFPKKDISRGRFLPFILIPFINKRLGRVRTSSITFLHELGYGAGRLIGSLQCSVSAQNASPDFGFHQRGFYGAFFLEGNWEMKERKWNIGNGGSPLEVEGQVGWKNGIRRGMAMVL